MFGARPQRMKTIGKTMGLIQNWCYKWLRFGGLLTLTNITSGHSLLVLFSICSHECFNMLQHCQMSFNDVLSTSVGLPVGLQGSSSGTHLWRALWCSTGAASRGNMRKVETPKVGVVSSGQSAEQQTNWCHFQPWYKANVEMTWDVAGVCKGQVTSGNHV
jgi:hypothetical protein